MKSHEVVAPDDRARRRASLRPDLVFGVLLERRRALFDHDDPSRTWTAFRKTAGICEAAGDGPRHQHFREPREPRANIAADRVSGRSMKNCSAPSPPRSRADPSGDDEMRAETKKLHHVQATESCCTNGRCRGPFDVDLLSKRSNLFRRTNQNAVDRRPYGCKLLRPGGALYLGPFRVAARPACAPAKVKARTIYRRTSVTLRAEHKPQARVRNANRHPISTPKSARTSRLFCPVDHMRRSSKSDPRGRRLCWGLASRRASETLKKGIGGLKPLSSARGPLQNGRPPALLRYGTNAMEVLINDILKRGGRRVASRGESVRGRAT